MKQMLGDPFDPLAGLLGLDRSAFALDVTVGPWRLQAEGRAVYLLVVSVILLVVAGVLVLVSRKPELRRRWTTWVLILPVIGIPIWLGPGPTAALAALLGLQAVREYALLVRLPRPETVLLLILAVGYPVAAWLEPGLLALVPLMALVCAGPALLAGDAENGLERAALAGFGSIWICWSLAMLVVVWPDAYLICFAAAAADVAAWAGGNGLRRFGWARRPLSPLSPNKTVGGVVGAAFGTLVVLLLLGSLSVGLFLAVVVGGIGGDLLESMVKRRAGVKDAGTWLPGFGGLLDRIDSLLLVLPLAAVLA